MTHTITGIKESHYIFMTQNKYTSIYTHTHTPNYFKISQIKQNRHLNHIKFDTSN